MSNRSIPLVPEKTEPLPALGSKEGLLSWLASVDHKLIGIMYIVTAGIFFVIGGLEAMVMRLQLGLPANNSFLTPEIYNQLFTMHGTTMIFLVVVPLMIGFGVYLVPLMIGARDMAFPRLNLLSFWMLAFGGIFLYFSFLAGGAPDAGWFAYTPLSGRPYSLSHGMDYWAIGLLAAGIGTIASGINFIVTIITRRAPGMKMTQVPMFVWTTFVNSFLIILALPALNAALVMLLADRLLYANFFTPQTGGSPILWQHYFWAFGHPEVYIMILPAWGMIAEVIPVFSRKPLFGFAIFAASSVAIALLSFAVYAHHMFADGLGHAFDALFGASSELIAIPTGIKIFNWIATMWGGRIRFTTSMLFAISFLVTFTIGGVSGVTFAVVPTDWQTTDSYYVVAHLHYVLFGGTMFAVFAGTYYWFPKMTGRLLSEKWGKWHFWTTFIGFNLTFFIQHVLGLMGMPRRVYTYPDYPFWGLFNQISTLGALLLGISVLLFFWNIVRSLRKGHPAEDNPWDAWTLEWATTSPPPEKNFSQLPAIKSRRPLWDYKHPQNPDWLQTQPKKQTAKSRQSISPALPRPGNLVTDRRKLGMLAFIASEGVFFLLLILAFVYFHYQNSPAQSLAQNLDTAKTLVFTVCLVASSGTLWLAERSLKKNNKNKGAIIAWLVVTAVLGLVFLAGQGLEYFSLFDKGINIQTTTFGTTFFTLTSFHALHVFSGIVVLAILAGLGFIGLFKRPGALVVVQTVSYYWHFVDIVWLVIFTIVYLLK